MAREKTQYPSVHKLTDVSIRLSTKTYLIQRVLYGLHPVDILRTMIRGNW